MIQAEYFVDMLTEHGVGFFTGVPDSQLKPLCNCLMERFGISDHHVIAANEGNCVGLAAGYHMATGKIPCVYMQNSGLGNIVNPVASLLNEKVYAIPAVFVVGWRGEPGVKDEPQHIFQGEITLKLLEDLGIETMVISQDTSEEEISARMKDFDSVLQKGKNVAFVVRKGGLSYSGKPVYKNGFTMLREAVIEKIVAAAGDDIIVSTTGKASRELFEIRERGGMSHKYDFLTVGSMGHSSMIALGIATYKPHSRIWCIDGDGAVLMHMGATAVIGSKKPENFIHVVLNNCAHETVGGLPTVFGDIEFTEVAKACGYRKVLSVSCEKALLEALEQVKTEKGPILLEVKVSLGSREDLGRPTTTAVENKQNFMNYLKECN